MVQLQQTTNQRVFAHLGENGVTASDVLQYTFVNQMTDVSTRFTGTVHVGNDNNGRAVKSFGLDCTNLAIGMYVLQITVNDVLRTTQLCYISPTTNAPVNQQYNEHLTNDTDTVYKG
ncbi:MAG: hypothetical protein Unbinned1446contig1005_3 [Prokaryotic dsDNA virus sp.]|nr:MAG: hypothetical protein Unbinned1446contig1005_3 [Prokaryotic dsDNA virus sp.]|tara:strand:+ start:389 stop:739 length:351 start_codon:yes stop_codon:yes gene_type:complete